MCKAVYILPITLLLPECMDLFMLYTCLVYVHVVYSMGGQVWKWRSGSTGGTSSGTGYAWPWLGRSWWRWSTASRTSARRPRGDTRPFESLGKALKSSARSAAGSSSAPWPSAAGSETWCSKWSSTARSTGATWSPRMATAAWRTRPLEP